MSWFWQSTLVLGLSIIGHPQTALAQAHKDSALHYYDLGQYDRALPFFERVYEELRATSEWDSLAKVTIRYANALEAQGNYFESYQLLSDTYGFFAEEEGYERSKVGLLNDLAFALRFLGEFDIGMQVLKESLRLGMDHFEDADKTMGQTYEYLAILSDDVGVGDSVEYYLDLAEETYLASLDSTDRFLGTFYNNAALLIAKRGKHDQALAHYFKALHISKLTFGEQHPNVGMIYNNIAGIYAGRKLFDEAIGYMSQSLEIAKSTRHPTNELTATYNLASYHIMLSNYDKGLPLMHRAVDLCRLHLGEDDIFMSSILDMLSEVYSQQDRGEEAVQAAKRSLELKQGFYGNDHIDVAQSCFTVANALQKSGKIDDALSYAKQSLSLRIQLLGKHDQKTADSHHQLGEIYQLRHEYPEAQAQFYEALSIYQSNPFAKGAILDSYTRLGDLQRMQIKFIPAIALYRRGLGSVYLGDSLKTGQIPTTDQIGYAPNLALNIQGLMISHFLYYQKKPDLHRLHLDSALMYSDFWLEFIDEQTKLGLGESTAFIWSNYSTQLFGYAAEITYEAYLQDSSARYIDQAWNIINRTKYAALRKAMQHHQAIRFAGLPESILHREQGLKKKIAELRSNIFAQDSAAQYELTQHQLSYQELLAEMAAKYPKYFELQYESPYPSIESIQDQIGDSTQVLQYVIGQGFFFCISITNRDAQFYRLPIAEPEVYQLMVDSLVNAMRNQDCATFQHHSARLASDFFEPVVEVQVKELIIIPDHFLYRINFEFLVSTEVDQCFFKELDYAIKHYNIRYVYLPEEISTDPTRNSKNRMLAVAPGFDRALLGSNLRGQDSSFNEVLSLPWARQTAVHLKQKLKADALVDDAATETQVKNRFDEYEILHFGTHAEISDANPMLSRLLLLPDREARNDGFLYTHEIYGLPINASLVSLTACETGLGKLQSGEGMLSLARAFRYAGCPSVAMSLWKIDDQSSAEIMQNFYLNLDAGSQKDKALRASKLDYLVNAPEELTNPLYWGGMVLVGDTSAVDIVPIISLKWPFALGVLLFALFLIYQLKVIKQKKVNSLN